jgi:hypothetical protein
MHSGIPQSVVADIYQDFCKATGNDNKMEKEEFRHLFRKMYINSQPRSLPTALPIFLTKHDLNKISDEVFDTYDLEGTGNSHQIVSYVILICFRKIDIRG